MRSSSTAVQKCPPYACTQGRYHKLFSMIVAHIIFDAPALKTHSTTRRSWYISTLPHLHDTLNLWRYASDPALEGFTPPEKLDEILLLRLVRLLRIMQNRYTNLGFYGQLSMPGVWSTSPGAPRITDLDPHPLTPQAHPYFGHFALTLASRGSLRGLSESSDSL